MFKIPATQLAAAVFILGGLGTAHLQAQSVPAPIVAKSGRFSFGTSSDPSYTAFVIPLDFQKGVQLDPMTTAPWAAGQPAEYYPWFFKNNQSVRYLISSNGTGTPTYPTPMQNPVVAFGSAGGGTPLYINQSYRFALHGGDLTADTDLPDEAVIEVFAKSDFAGNAVGQVSRAVTKLDIAHWKSAAAGGLTTAWKQFGDNGFQNTFITEVDGKPVLETVVQLALNLTPDGKWGDRYAAPLLITHRALPGAENYYFQLNYCGAAIVGGSAHWMAVADTSNPTNTGDYVVGYAMNFDPFPAWGSIQLKTPNFQGDPAPPTYYGKTADEISPMAPRFEDELATSLQGNFKTPTPQAPDPFIPADGAYKALGQTAELQQHSKLDDLATELGNDPMAIANYVHNEIALTDALGYNETGDVDEAAVNAGGMNRGALGAYLEGQGSPEEQCALLLYLLRKAKVQAGYIKPPHVLSGGNASSPVKMLDQRLSNLLRMRIKGEMAPDGSTTVPKFIGVNYPWVAAYVKQPDNTWKWVHLFPWLKDTEVVEGLSIEGYLPGSAKSVRQWTRDYILAGKNSRLWSLDPEDHTAGNIFIKDLQDNLQKNWKGLSSDSIGVRFRDRRFNRTAWNQFPQPCQVDKTQSYTVSDTLSSDSKLYDTVDITIASVQNPSRNIQVLGVRTLDLHNRRAILDFKPYSGHYNMTFTLEAFDLTKPDVGTGNFGSGDPYLRKKQLSAVIAVDNTDKDFTCTVVYKRHRAYNGLKGTQNQAALGGWASFLGINEYGRDPSSTTAPETTTVSYFKLGDMNAFCLNAGRVTDKMIQYNLEPFWKHQQARAANANLLPDYDLIQGTMVYLMGMSYYQRVSNSFESLKNLFKINVASMRAHGFAQFGAMQDASGNPVIATVTNPSGGTEQRLQQVYPVVDMNFFRNAWSGYGDIRPDAGGQQNVTGSDFLTNLFVVNNSCLEDWAISQYFPQETTDAISTMNLIQRIQQDDSNPNKVIELDSNNYTTYQTKSFTFSGVTKTLEAWAGPSTWGQVVAAFTGWDKDLVRVYITPGPVVGAKGQWKGMGALILAKDFGAALIGRINGGAGSIRFGGSNLFVAGNGISIPNSTIIVGSSGYPSIVQAISYNASTILNSAVTNYIVPALASYNSAAATQYSTGNAAVASTNYLFSNVLTNASFPALNSAINSTFSSGAVGTISFAGGGLQFIGSTNTFAAGQSNMAGDPVNMLTGELYVDDVDLTLPGPIPLQVRRNYGSQSMANDQFGYGWKMAYFPYLVPNDSSTYEKIQAAELDGSVIVYTRNTANTSKEEWTVLAADNPMLGNGSGMQIGSVCNPFLNRLERTVSGTVTRYTLYGSDGSTRVYEVRSFPVYGSSVTRLRPYLKSWSDSVGNTLTFLFYGDGVDGDFWHVPVEHSSYGQLALVKASNGNTLGFHYDVNGHVLDIFTGDGRRLSYSYDSDGDLRSVSLPDGGWVKYDYLREQGKVGATNNLAWYSTHLLNRETHPGGRMVESDYLLYKANDLDDAGIAVTADKIGKASHLRRVTAQRGTVGEHAAGEDETVPAAESYKPVQNATYTFDNTTNAQSLVTGRTTILDAYGRKTIYYYVNSRITKIADPLTQLTDETNGVGTNFKLVQEWYTAADVTPGVIGGWAGGMKAMQPRGGPRTEFKYSDDGKGDVASISVMGELNGKAATADTATTTATYNSLHLPEVVTHPHPDNGTATGRKTKYYYFADVPRRYLVSKIEQLDVNGVVINRATNEYENVFTDSSGNKTSDISHADFAKPFAKGLLQQTKGAAETTDEATTEWEHDARGFITKQTAYSGETDQTNYPNAVTTFDYNLRGELTEERSMDGNVAKKTNRYAYDDMGRRIWVERLDSARKQIAWDYTYYNLTGEVEWTDSSRTNPEDYTYTRYDGAGRPVEKTAWRSRAKADGTGVEAVPGQEAYSTSKFFYNMFGDLIKVMDPRGNTVKATYDKIGRKLSTVAYEGDWQAVANPSAIITETTSYDDAARRVTTTDAKGATTTVTATSDGRPMLKVNPDDTQLKWTYFLDGRPCTEPISPTIYKEYSYDDLNRIVTQTVKNATHTLGSTSVEMDRRGNVVKSTDMAGLVTSATYDKLNRVITTSIPAAGTTSAEQLVTHYYDATGFFHRTKNALDQYSETSSDALGRPLSTKVLQSNLSTVVSLSSFSYDKDFNSVTTFRGSETGANAMKETTWTDTAGHTVLVRHADNTFATVTYDAAGNAIAATNETGQTSQTVYDGLNRVSYTVQPDGATTQFVYTYPDGGGMQTERRMPQNLTEVNNFDSVGRLTSKYLKEATGNTTSRNYGSYHYYAATESTPGLLKDFTDPLGLVHQATYDQWMRPASVQIGTVNTPAYVKREYLTYDVRGMVTQLRETTTPPAPGLTTTTPVVTQVDRTYDVQGHLYDEKVSLGGNVVTHLTETFDAAGHRVTLERGTSVTSLGGSDAGHAWAFGYREDGLLKQVKQQYAVGVTGTYDYEYGNNGLLKKRTNPFRTHTVNSRDTRGRLLSSATHLTNPGTNANVVEEALGWTFDSKQSDYTATRIASVDATGSATWNDVHHYEYDVRSRRLVSESLTPAPGQAAKTTNYEFDHDARGGLGIRTRSYSGIGATTQEHLVGDTSNAQGWNKFARVTNEISGFEKRGFSVQGTALGAKSVGLRVGNDLELDNVNFSSNPAHTTGAWSRDVWLPGGGSYTLNASANHPSGQFTDRKQVSFNLLAAHWKMQPTYDEEGQTLTRPLAGGATNGGRSQTLTWDGAGRLIRVVQTEYNGPGFEWSAVYDGFNRRIQTTSTPKTSSGVLQSSLSVIQRSWYDPGVEFLEVAIEVTRAAASTNNTERWWKIHGPDLNGGYGGLQGMGGLEAVINEKTGQAVGMVDDAYGHILGFAKSLNGAGGTLTAAGPTGPAFPTAANQITFEWHSARFSGYGPQGGNWSASIEEGVAVWRTFGWRGKRMEVTGFYHLGARYYEPNSARFLSPDPMGHGASMSLYDYANGDPINFVDPRGRSPKAISGGAVLSSSVTEAAMTQILGKFSFGNGQLNNPMIRRMSPQDLQKTILNSFVWAALQHGASVDLAKEVGGNLYARMMTYRQALQEAKDEADEATKQRYAAYAKAVVNFSEDIKGIGRGIFNEVSNTLGGIFGRLDQDTQYDEKTGSFSVSTKYTSMFGMNGDQRAEAMGGMLLNAMGGRLLGGASRSSAYADDIADSIFARRTYCFAAGTKVATPEGEKNIEDIQLNDLVLSYDFAAKKILPREVKNIIHGRTEHWYIIRLGNNEVKVTGRHPFWVQNEQRWAYAHDLKVGMILQNNEGKILSIQSIKFTKLTTSEYTFNFEVANDHNYFAGASGETVLVHNTDPWEIYFSRPPSDITLSTTFGSGPSSSEIWAGRTVGEAVEEARQLGRLPDGLRLNATIFGEERIFVAANNRTLWVAQQAGLRDITVYGLDSGSVSKTVMTHITETAGPFCPPW